MKLTTKEFNFLAVQLDALQITLTALIEVNTEPLVDISTQVSDFKTAVNNTLTAIPDANPPNTSVGGMVIGGPSLHRQLVEKGNDQASDSNAASVVG